MEKLTILCLDDQREVLAALQKDLEPFTRRCTVELCESAEEAEEVVSEIDDAGGHLAVIVCDHIMPAKNGIEFLIEFDKDPRFPHTRKLLLTGLATHEDTIVAINRAHIDRYMEKPWEPGKLVDTIKVLLTEYVLQTGVDYEPIMDVLDQPALYEGLRRNA